MFKKVQDAIQTQRTIDTPLLNRQKQLAHNNQHDKSQICIYTKREDLNSNNKSKQILPNSQSFNSLSFNQNRQTSFGIDRQVDQSNRRANLSNSQANQSNSLNHSKSKSFARQEQHSRTFYGSVQKKHKNQSDKVNNKTETIKDDYMSQNKSQRGLLNNLNLNSLSRKTQKLGNNQAKRHLLQVKNRRILDYDDSVNGPFYLQEDAQISQPRLNIETCQKYMNRNNQNAKAMNSLKEQKSYLQSINLFPKSKKSKTQPKDFLFVSQRSNLQNNRLKLNKKNLILSKKYNFTLKESNKKAINVNINYKAYNYLDYSINNSHHNYKSQSTFKYSSYFNYQTKKQPSLQKIVKKTEKQNLVNSPTLDTMKCSNYVQLEDCFKRQNDPINQQTFTTVHDIPQNILIQQQGLIASFKSNDLRNFSLQNYGLENGHKTYQIKNTTKVFICKFCLQIYSIFEIRQHKGSICQVVHKQSQFAQRIQRLIVFLKHTFQTYYQSREPYNCFKDLALKLSVKMQMLTNQDKFGKMMEKINFAFSLKQNYSFKNKSLTHTSPNLKDNTRRDRDKFFIEQIEKKIALFQIVQCQEVLNAVYKTIDIGKQYNSTGSHNSNIKCVRNKIILVKDLFWLINKLIEGLVLSKISN